jgi:hypothetical protein
MQKFKSKLKIFLNTFYFLLVLLTSNFLLLTFPVRAQQVSLSISPPLIQTVIKPGKVILIAYRLENSGDPTILTAKVVSFEPKDNLGNIRLKDKAEGLVRFSLDNAELSLDQPFFLKTKASEQLLLRIRVPEGAPEGDYYYSLLAETTPAIGQEGIGSAQAKATIASNILITISHSGVVEIKPKVVLFQPLSKLKWKIFDSFNQIPLLLVMENRGKNLIRPEGKITLRGVFGTSADYEIVPKNILAESQRLVEATPSAEFAKQPTSLVLSGFFLGPYKLSANINFGENSPTVFASTSFFAFPFKLLAGLIITIALIIFFSKKVYREEVG